MDKASIIFILVPEPNFNGTHMHFEKKIRLYKSFFGTIPLLISHGNFLLKPPPVNTNFRLGNFNCNALVVPGIIVDLIKNIDSNALLLAHYNSSNKELQELSNKIDNELVMVKADLSLEDEIIS